MSFLASAFSGTQNSAQPIVDANTIRGRENAASLNYGQANTGLNTLAQQLQQQSTGGGPNLANAQLQSATAQNVGNQAALMAGQRGAGSNVGLMSRQIANQGANIQQQAAGQSAQNVLAQQLAAQQQLGNVLGTQGQLANQFYGATSGEGANAQNLNAQVQGQNAKTNQGLVGGVANVVGKIASLAEGGQVDQGPMASWSQGSDWGFNFTSGNKPKPAQSNMIDTSKPVVQSAGQAGSPMVGQPMSNPMGTQVLHAANGAALPFAPMNLRSGGPVNARGPQEKAVKPGNNYANDKIPAMLSEGEVVLPREVTQSGNAPQAAANFMSQVMAGKHRGKKK